MIPSMRREYYEAAARHYRIQENISCMYADAHKEAMTMARCDWHRDAKSAELRVLDLEAMRKQALETAAGWQRLADQAVADAEAAKNEEIRRDYYSGPPGSFTGD